MSDAGSPRAARPWLAPALAFAAALAVRLLFWRESQDIAVLRTPTPGLDIQVYWDAARNLRAGLSPNLELLTCSAPLHVLWLAFLQQIFGESMLACRVAVAVLASARYPLLYFAALRLGARPLAAAIAAFALLLTPALVYFDTVLLKAATDLTLLTLLVLAVLHVDQAASLRRNAAALAAAAGLLILCFLNQVAALAYALPVTAAVALKLRSPRGLAAAGAVLGATLAAYALVAARATVLPEALRAPPPLTGINLYLSFNDAAGVSYQPVPDLPPYPFGHAFVARLLAEDAAQRPLTFAEADAHYRRAAAAFVAEHPARAAALALGRIRLALSQHEAKAEDYLPWLAQRSRALSWPPFGFGLFLLAAVLALARGRPAGAADRVLLCGLAAAILVTNALAFASFRFRAPLYVPVMLLASLAPLGIPHMSRARFAAVLALLVATAALAFAPSAALDHAERMRRADANDAWSVHSEELMARLAESPEAQDPQRRAELLLELHRYTEALRLLERLPPSPAYWRLLLWSGNHDAVRQAGIPLEATGLEGLEARTYQRAGATSPQAAPGGPANAP